jgi:hypothetical protein
MSYIALTTYDIDDSLCNNASILVFGIIMSPPKKTEIQKVHRESRFPVRNFIVFFCFKLWTVGWILFVLGAISRWQASHLKHGKHHKSWQGDYVRHPRVVSQSRTSIVMTCITQYVHRNNRYCSGLKVKKLGQEAEARTYVPSKGDAQTVAWCQSNVLTNQTLGLFTVAQQMLGRNTVFWAAISCGLVVGTNVSISLLPPTSWRKTRAPKSWYPPSYPMSHPDS